MDVGQALMKEIFKVNPPIQLLTEFLQLGGAKMSGSVGNVIDLETWLSVAHPELFRFMNFSYRSSTAINFSFEDNSFVLLNDRFERAERVFYKEEEAENEKRTQALSKIYEFSCIGKPGKRMVQLPFSTAVLLSQVLDFENNFEEIPKDLSKDEKQKIKEKLARTKSWVSRFAPENFRIEFSESLDRKVLAELNSELIAAISSLPKKISNSNTPEEVQQAIYDSAKASNVKPKDLFRALYLILIGKERGPKIGSLVFAFGKEKVKKRLIEASK